MRVLFLLPEPPYPPQNGPHHHTFGLLRIACARHTCVAAGLYRGEAGLARWRQLQEALPGLRVAALFPEAEGIRRSLRGLGCLLAWQPLVLRGSLGGALPAWVRRYLRQERVDLVHVDQFRLAHCWRACGATPRLLVPYDAFSLKCLRAYRTAVRPREKAAAWYLYRAFSRLERLVYPHFDLVCPVSPVDARWLAGRDSRIRTAVVGIPVPEEFLRAGAAGVPEADGAHILCAGWFSSDGVAAGAIEFLKEALPRIRDAVPEARVTLWGRRPTPALRAVLKETPGVRHVEWVDDYAGMIRSAQAYVYPQACGAGIQTKVQQAMALGVPVVAREETLAPLEVESGRHAFGCQTPQEMAEAVVAILTQPGLRREVGAAGAAHMRARFSAEAIGAELDAAYRLAAPEVRGSA